MLSSKINSKIYVEKKNKITGQFRTLGEKNYNKGQ